jgi:predicted  nucleic acid-binding Zn-ribbon protein
MSDNDLTPETRPCAHCGRPVLQRASAGRPFRYCRDNDGECQRASRNNRMRHRSSPGLAGQVARTWEVVDRLDQLVETLTDALHSELSPAGVERQLAELRAETSSQLAAAHTERDEARRDAERADAAVATAQQLTAAAVAERDEARHRAEDEERRATAAAQAAEEAHAQRDEARREATAAAALRERAETERDAARDELTAARESARAELAAAREAARDELANARTELERTRHERDEIERGLASSVREAQNATARADELQQAAEDLKTAGRELTAQLTAANKTIDEVRREAATARATADAELAQLRQALTTAVTDRDAATRDRDDLQRAVDRATQDLTDLERRLTAARAEADTAQSRAAQLSTQVSDLASALASLGTRPPTQPNRSAEPTPAAG